MDADPDPVLSLLCGSESSFHFDADPDPDPSFQITAENLKKCSNRPIFHTFWLVTFKTDADPDQAYHFDAGADLDPAFQFNEDTDSDPTF